MRIKLYFIYLLIIILSTTYCIEYREVIFYPNGSQYVGVDKLVVNISENLSNIYINYRNFSFYIPTSRVYVYSLPSKKFNISVIINGTKIDNNEWYIYYTIKNGYNFDLNVECFFPNGYNYKNISITIPKKGYKTIILKKYDISNQIYFEDSNISFKVPTTLTITYTKFLPFSIIKSNNLNKWNVVYIIKNPFNEDFYVNASYYYIVNGKIYFLDNCSYYLKSKENITKNFTIISNDVPTFYVKYTVYHVMKITDYIVPATKINKNKYIIGIGKVVGTNIVYLPTNKGTKSEVVQNKENPENNEKPKNPLSKSEEEQNKENPENNKKPKNNKKSKNPPSKSEEERNKENPENNKKPKKEKPNIIPLYPIVFIHKSKSFKQQLSSIQSLIIFMFINANILIILLKRLTIITDNEKLLIFPFSIYLKDEYLTIEELEIVEEIASEYNLDEIYAKAIYLAAKYGGILYIKDRKAYEIAKELGLECYLL